MSAWNGEADRFVTSDKDTWIAEKKPERSNDPHSYLRDAELTKDKVEGAVEALRYAARIVTRRCYPTDVGDMLMKQAEAIEAEWERRQTE